MSVKIIRKNQGAEVTDKMLHAAYEARNNFVFVGDSKEWDSQVAEAMRTAFEAARETEIERIYISHQEQRALVVLSVTPDFIVFTETLPYQAHIEQIQIHKDNVGELATALFELERQLNGNQ